MNQILSLREKRAKLWNDTKAFLDSHRGEDGMVSAEDNATYEKMEADVVALGKEIERLERQAAIDRELDQPTASVLVSKPGAVKPEQKAGRASDEYKKAFWNQMRGKVSPEVFNALQVGTLSEGGYTVPDEFDKQLIDGLEDKKGAVDDNLRIQRFNTLKEKLPDVLDVHSWHEFIKAIMNAGYLSGDLILSGNAVFYTYALYLIAKHRFNASYNENMHLTSLWFFYASLISLYTGSFESTVENHLNTIKSLKTLDEYKEFILSRVNERLTNDYFDITLVGSEGLAVSGRGNNAWNAYVASLNIMNAKILFSKSNLLVSKLFEPGTDGNRKSLEKHHLFPKAYLKSQGYSDAKINQMANYAFIDWKDNMDILDDAPSVYYPIVCAGLSDEQISVMEEENALPHGWENMAYEDFLIERRKLMAAKIKAAFEILKKAAT